MIDVIGTALWNDRGEFNIQTNDPLEQLYRKLVDQIRLKYPEVHWGHLESCGVNACTNCLAVTNQGRKRIIEWTKTPGGYVQQLPHLLIGFLNDPKNYDLMRKCRENLDPAKIQGNRVPQYYTLLAKKFLGIPAHFEWGCDFEKVKQIVSEPYPVQLCYRKPGHYVTAKAWDKKDNFLYSDNSWPRGGDGFNEKIRPEDFANIHDWLIWYEIK